MSEGFGWVREFLRGGGGPPSRARGASLADPEREALLESRRAAEAAAWAEAEARRAALESMSVGEQVGAYGDFFVDPLLELGRGVVDLVPSPAVPTPLGLLRGGVRATGPEAAETAAGLALLGAVGPMSRGLERGWRALSQREGLVRAAPGGWRTAAGGPVSGEPAAPVSGRRGKAEKLHDLASDPRTPAHEAAAARSAYESLTGESLSPPSGRASMRAAYEARAPKPGRAGVREAHAPVEPPVPSPRSGLRDAYEGGQRPGSRLLTSPDDWTPDLSSWNPEIAAEVSRMVPREAQGLFHVTTNYGGVRKNSLKSGDDVPGSVGLGSAGAGKGRVSVTYDRRKAELIRDGLRLAGAIGRGESTAADVLAFFEGAHGLRLASDGYRTNRFGEGVFSPVGRLLSGKASSTVESLLPHLSPETKGWVEGGFQPVGNWDAEAMYDEIRTAASIVYDTPQKQAHLFKELDTSFWHGSPLPSSERPKLLLFGDAKSWSRIDPADVQILDLDVRRGALPEGGQDRSLSTWGREREFKASDFVIPGEQEMRFNPEDIRVRWDDLPSPGRPALRAAYEAGKPEPVAPEPPPPTQTPAGKWALRPDVDPDDAQRLIPRSVSARLWKGTDRTIPDHVLMHYEKEIQHTLDGWIDEFMQTQAGALQDDRWDTPLPTLGPDEAWSEAVKDPKFRSLLETRDRIAAKIESLHSSPPPPTQTPDKD